MERDLLYATCRFYLSFNRSKNISQGANDMTDGFDTMTSASKKYLGVIYA
jgi:hypothetical protein